MPDSRRVGLDCRVKEIMSKDARSNEQSQNRLRMLFFVPEHDTIITNQACRLYLDDLVNSAQFDITLMAPNGPAMASYAEDANLIFHPISDFGQQLLKRTPQLWPILTATRRWRYDIALSHAGYACQGLSAISRKVVGICHDDHIEPFSAAHHLILLNSGIADHAQDLIAQEIFDDAPVIDLLPHPYICQYNEIKPLNLPSAPLTIGTSAPFVEGDGLGIFIHMAQLLEQTHPDTKFIIAGNGPTEHDMKELADHIAPFIEFTGPLSPEELADSIDIFCLTSAEAPYPRALCEMMDPGIACLSTCTNGAMDILKGGMVAPIVPIDDAFMLAVQLQELLDDRAHIERIKKACFERIREEDFSMEQFSNRLLHLLIGK